MSSNIIDMAEEIIDPALAEQQQPPKKKPRNETNDDGNSNQQNAVKFIVAFALFAKSMAGEQSDNDAPSDSNSLPMKIQLPLETWVDALAFVPRWQLGKVVDQIRNRQFAKIIQFFLHKCGEITLNNMEIFEPRGNGCHPMVIAKQVKNNRATLWLRKTTTTLSDGPPPKNVKDFTSINLSYLDTSVLKFLRILQQHDSPLLTNVNFSILYPKGKNNLLTILANLLPLITSINSIHLWDHNFKQINEAASNNRGHQLLAIKLKCWLKRDAWKSRLFIGQSGSQLFILLPRIFDLEPASLENDKTGERLVIKKASYGNGMLISRYPLKETNKWEKAEEEAEYWRFGQQGRRIIRLQRDLKMAL